ncbi:hypothetical protein BP00DRAFT_105981 [Aspergillus indologenus CBS 114.80]|uniref:Uncharacterized protein n=1 Tax=Aspergillus indologenus CBS 114.80 TaxID=1450541 RepID=A0A2V5IQA2_9EURO|nr:hypothetical protein BP00DRAFT_105981 [Aspergillus indologenus CBS 114.80]
MLTQDIPDRFSGPLMLTIATLSLISRDQWLLFSNLMSTSVILLALYVETLFFQTQSNHRGALGIGSVLTLQTSLRMWC